ncbi:MAG: hypothetical protein DDT25_01077 [Chloroflexi bacterium]|nr:hypothetical protein [Chloroflexota bacterium]
MEVPPGDDLPRLRKDQGVIGGRVYFPLQDTSYVGKGITGGAMNLWNTADGVCILNPSVISIPQDFTPLKETPDILCAANLTGVGPDPLDFFIEG